MKIIKSFLCIALSLSVVMVRGFQESVPAPAHKRQRVECSGKDEEEKVAQQQELGIQDTLAKFINRDPVKIVKSYLLGWKHESYEVREKLKLDESSSVRCCALGRNEKNEPIVYIGTDVVNIFNPRTETSSIIFDQQNCSLNSIISLAPECYAIETDRYTLVHMEDKTRYFQIRKGFLSNLFTMSGRINKDGKPVLFATMDNPSKYFDPVQSVTPTLRLIPFDPINTKPKAYCFLSNCSVYASCMGKSKNDDCIAYQVTKDSIEVFNLETETFKKTFKIDPKLLPINNISCSANDKGCVAVGSFSTGCICIYDEDGTLLKEITVPGLCSINLDNKERCIVGDANGVLRSYSITSGEVQDMGIFSSRLEQARWKERSFINTPIPVYSALDSKPTTIAAVNQSGVINIWTDEAEAIEAYDAELKARSAQDIDAKKS